MRKAGIALMGWGCLVTIVAACVGGPGPLPDQGPDQSSQGGGIQGASKSGTTGTSMAAANAQTIEASAFDRSCTVDADCVGVFEGRACAACKCPNAAIAKKDQQKFDSELTSRTAECPASEEAACEPCPTQNVGCDPDTKQCAMGKKSNVPDAG